MRLVATYLSGLLAAWLIVGSIEYAAGIHNDNVWTITAWIVLTVFLGGVFRRLHVGRPKP